MITDKNIIIMKKAEKEQNIELIVDEITIPYHYDSFDILDLYINYFNTMSKTRAKGSYLYTQFIDFIGKTFNDTEELKELLTDYKNIDDLKSYYDIDNILIDKCVNFLKGTNWLDDEDIAYLDVLCKYLNNMNYRFAFIGSSVVVNMGEYNRIIQYLD